MPTNLSRLVKELSRADIEKLLAAKDELESLETRRQELQKELADVEKRLARLAGQVLGRRPGRPKKTAKKAAKKTTKKAAKKTTKKTTKKAAKKTLKKTVKRGKTRKVAARPARGRGKAAAGGKVTLEDVVVQVLKGNGGPMSFKDLLATITGKKLFKSKSKAFDNVLRRTLSTSDRVKRVGRGVYGL